MAEPVRCAWAIRTPLEIAYHDEEWGSPRYDDRTLFEFLLLESAQAGLSWSTILKKREGYRIAFAGFLAEKVARFTEADVDRLVQDASIVRHRGKIESAIGNARLFLELAEKHGAFSNYLWAFVDGKPIQNRWTDLDQIPSTSDLSDRIAKEFKRIGFRFFGSTIVYAYMQAVGMVNDHLTSCFRHDICRREQNFRERDRFL